MTPLPPLPDGVRFAPDSAQPLALLKACPAYQPTPLRSVTLADGRAMLVKDETARMRLGSFKALGGVYAVAQLIAQRARAGHPRSEGVVDYASPAVRAIAAEMTFVCASAGNHGLSVAAGTRIFGATARIHIADTVPESFASRLHAQGAQVKRSGATYEDSLKAAEADASASGATLLADGSWLGYTVPPALVMEGYTVLAEEMRSTLEASGDWPDAVYLQAGVGGLAAAVADRIRHNWAVQPRIVVVEPEAAPCLQASIAEGRPVRVEGPVSAMGRLDCKEPSLLALETLKRTADDFVLVSEAEADAAVALAAEHAILTTPSGAAGFAAALRGTAERPLVIMSEGVA